MAFFQTKSGKEIELAEEFVKATTVMDKGDDEVNLKEYDYPHRQHLNQPQDSIQQVLYYRVVQNKVCDHDRVCSLSKLIN